MPRVRRRLGAGCAKLRVRLDQPPGPGGVHLRPSRGLAPERAAVLEALFDLPLGASVRDVARHLGRARQTAEHHLHRLKRSGHVMEIKRGYRKRRVLVPVRVRLTDAEREWLKLGPVTARAILIVSRARGELVTSATVARSLGWTRVGAIYHLRRAVQAGILDAAHNRGYAIKDGPGLEDRYLKAVQWIAENGGQAHAWQVAQGLGWSLGTTKRHLARAVHAGLITSQQRAGYTISPSAGRINWHKSTKAST